MNVFPQSTGFRVRVTDLITGADVSTVTLRVTVVVFPALSLATIVMVFAPSTRVTSLVNVPSVPTVTVTPLTVTVTGLDDTSSVLPLTVTVFLLVIRSFDGAVICSVGGTVSTVNVAVLAAAALPSLSDALTEIVCDPSFNVGDVHVHLYPPSIAVFVTVDTAVPSTVTTIVPAFTPESVSFTWNSIVGVVFVI